MLVILEHKSGQSGPGTTRAERPLRRGEIGSQVGHGISGGSGERGGAQNSACPRRGILAGG